jgi:glycosyltransferase involved in cell wall biosynthesis
VPVSALCVIVKNEEMAVAEWISYHKLIGFEEIIIYDNGSTDRTAAIISIVSRLDPTVTYKFWRDEPGRAPQLTAYSDALENSTADWLAFFDIDEFLVLHRHANVNAYLTSVADNISALAINWLVFGSAARIKPGTGLVMERFTNCASRRHPKNMFCKSIVRRTRAATIGVHTAKLTSGLYADSQGVAVELSGDAKTAKVSHDGAQLNHYLLKSWEEFKMKRARGNAARPPESPQKYNHRGNSSRRPRPNSKDSDDEYWIKHDLNSNINNELLRWSQPVRAKLKAWGIAVPAGKSSALRAAAVSIWTFASTALQRDPSSTKS